MNLMIDGRRALFVDLIDYAGMFPPATLSLQDAVAEYRRARTGPHGWLLGRFLCPTSRLEDLAAHLTTAMQPGEPPWRVSAIFDEPLGPAAMHTRVFDRYMSPAATVAFIEAGTPSDDGRPTADAYDQIAPTVTAAAGISGVVMPFLEIEHTGGWEMGIPDAVEAISRLSRERIRPLGAKFRTGGLTPEAFPSPAQLALFISSCFRLEVPFKATAGLHGPIRHADANLGVIRHGFVNLLAAAAFSHAGAGTDVLIKVLEEQDPDAFKVTAVGLRWRDDLAGTTTLRSTRGFFRSYGSCSFDEPIAHLNELQMLAGVMT